jgi:RimJ/RimL family protein N-acetyltransferase
MIEVKPFKKADLKQIKEQKATSKVSAQAEEVHYDALEKMPYAFSIFIQGKVVACAGVIQQWPGRGIAWAIVDELCKREFLALHNVVKRFLDVCPIRRIEATVDVGFEQGHRWVKLLGFQLEAPMMKHYGPDGSHAALYARVRC